MLTRHFLAFFLAALLSVLSWSAQAQCMPGCTLHIAKVSNNDLNFGTVVVIGGGKLIINPSDGTRTGTASVVTPTSITSIVGSAAFEVTCTGGAGMIRYTLSLTTPSIVKSTTGEMDLSVFVTSPTSISEVRTVWDCKTYKETIKIGATLTVGGNQPAGSYTSTGGIALTVRKSL